MPKVRQQHRPVSGVEGRPSESPASAPGRGEQSKRTRANPPTIVTLDEAATEYDGEWALMRVVGSDPETHAPIGEILVHSPSRRKINTAHQRARLAEPDVELAIVLGGTQRRSADELQALFDKAAQGPYVNALW